MFVLKSSAIEAERGLTLREAVPQTSHAGSSWELPKPAETLPGKICRKANQFTHRSKLAPREREIIQALVCKSRFLGQADAGETLQVSVFFEEGREPRVNSSVLLTVFI